MVGRNVKVRNVVVRVCDSLDGGVINSVLNKHGCKWCARRYRLANDHVPPRGGHPIPANADLNSMDMHRPIVAALDILVPCPDQLYRRAAQTFCDHRRLTLYVGIGNGAPAKASTGQLRVKGDLVRFQAENFSDGGLIHSLEL